MSVKIKINLEERLLNSGRVIVEVGAGLTRRVPSAITIDQLDFETIDIVANINEGIGFLPNESVDEFHSTHVLEHVSNFEQLMREMHRTLKKGGKICGTVPHFANPYFYSDYTHSSFFGLYTFCYFSKQDYFKRKVPPFYNDFYFEIISIDLEFKSEFLFRKPFKKGIQLIFNSCRFMKELHESMFCYIIPAYQIRFDLRKIM